MPAIYHQFPINADREAVFQAISTPEGLNQWWTLNCHGYARQGDVCQLDFGPGYLWRAQISRFAPNKAIEWTMQEADPDWEGTKVGFELESSKNGTSILFYHTGWPENNAHFRSSTYCWAMYLRILKRFVEYGEHVPYDRRLEV